ncbi:MAG: hypothetical protein M1832_003945 [Thelocarpon impressellum]|nr:MAG: hypothetical protein M1832_003945 [Thelocarpon impressellum]
MGPKKPAAAAKAAAGKPKNGASRNKKKAHKQPASAAARESRPAPPSAVPLELQQRLLTAFTAAFPVLLTSGDEHLGALVQRVKAHLYARDFDAAFGMQALLEAYAVRWSAGRAVGYLAVFQSLSEILLGGDRVEEKEEEEEEVEEERKGDGTFNVVALGGGAGAEVVALAGWFSSLLPSSSTPSSSNVSGQGEWCKKLAITAVDIADWSPILSLLEASILSPTHSTLLSPSTFALTFSQTDILTLPPAHLTQLLHAARLVTLLFTLNELYTASLARTTALLLGVGVGMRKGGLLLVLDSPGSYSTVSLNNSQRGEEQGEGRRYPMQWLLDRTLLGTDTDEEEGEGQKWEKLVGDESRWFRVPEGLQYPVRLENMRVQVHLYRRL